VIYSNPAAALKRAAIREKEFSLPSVDKFNALIAEMRNGHGRGSRNCADFALGLAVTGMRNGETNALEWRDIDFELAEIIVRGGKPNGFGKIKHGSGTPHLNQNPKWKLAATRLHRLQAARP
jgi:integrase